MNTNPEPPDATVLPAEYARTQRRRKVRVFVGLGLAFLLLGSLGACLIVQPMPFTKPGLSSIVVEPSKLEVHVRYLAEDCAPRHWRGREGLAKAGAYIEKELRDAGGRISEQVFEVRGKTYRNVIASFGPQSGPRIIVGAHYDACEPLPGADDNASGVAGLLELGRLLGAHPPAMRVELVAYTLEEPPFFRTQNMGSARHAQAVKVKGEAVRAMIALEMIGRFSDAPQSQAYPSFLISPLYPDRGNFIAVVGRLNDIGLTRSVKRTMRGATSLPVVSINAPRWIPGLDFSDHHPYWDRGFPAVMVTDTAFYRNTDYHTAQDTPERLDYLRMAQVVQGVHAAVERLTR